MIRLALPAMVAGLSVASTAQAAPSAFWRQDVNGAGETHYACGGNCAQSQLECVRFLMPAEAVDLATLADEKAGPWGQIDFWFASRVMVDRPDLFTPGVEPSGGRLGALERTSGWVEARYDLDVGGKPVVAILRLWPASGGIAGLRCAYLPKGGDVEAHIDELVD